MRTYRLEYGSGSLGIRLDPMRVRGETFPRGVRGVADVAAAVRASIERPIGAPPLRELLAGKTSALILTVDHTRPSPAALLGPIVDLCEALGVRVTVCVAVGRHRQMTADELGRHFPADLRKRVGLVQHDPFDDRAMVDLGATSRGTPVLVNRIAFEHDAVVGVGFLEPSYLAGFSGGRKLIMPGIAHHTAIDANHYLLTQPGAVIGRLAGNPVSEDAEEFARKVPFHFITYAVAGPRDEVVEVASGDPFAAHQEACLRTADLYRVAPAPADIVMSSPGGYPYDCDLVQTKKAIVPAGDLVNDGGAIVLVGECREGLGAEPTFLQWLRTMAPPEVAEAVGVRERFSLGAHGANILARPIVQRRAKVILMTRPDVCAELADTYIHAVPTLEAAWELAEAATGGSGSVAILHQARRPIVAT